VGGWFGLYKGTVQCPKTGGQVGKQVHTIWMTTKLM
jgi:hypothetical protein